MSVNFDRAASYYDASRGYSREVAAAIGRAIAGETHADSTTQFLEIGAGTGRIGLPLIALGHQYTGVDISAEMLHRFESKLIDLGQQTGRLPQARLLEADAHAMPFPDFSFDVVIATHVFHLVEDPRRVWQEVKRVLRPEGRLLICSDSTISGESVTVSERWRAILREETEAPSSSEVVSALLHEEQSRNPAMRMAETHPVRWQTMSPPSEELDGIAGRLWSHTWRIEDDVFERCLARLTAWATAHYGQRLAVPQACSQEFIIRSVSFF